MSVDGTGDVNVFLSSSRLGFGEPPPPTSSLLTFADMVLALDHKVNENVDQTLSRIGVKTESDHTYASSGSSRTTRSQTAKAAALIATSHFLENEQEERTLKKFSEEILSDSTTTRSVSFSPRRSLHNSGKRSKDLKGKRSSSVEDIHNSNAECESPFSVSRACEWPQVLTKGSPRKSCSFEEVSCDNSKSSIKTSRSSENVHRNEDINRTGVSHTLHRFVNDTLEFPCWPRKADHTYATATWDGTAASHSLFEQESHNDSLRSNEIVDQEMQEADNHHDYSVQDHNIECEEVFVTEDSPFQNFVLLNPAQKDDHTYVKSKTLSADGSSEGNTYSINTEGYQLGKQNFSSATFPRQKMREDHTYFHSGLSRKSSGGAGGKEWASAQTVANLTNPQAMQIEEVYRNLHSFSQSASAKKDHNYSTST